MPSTRVRDFRRRLLAIAAAASVAGLAVPLRAERSPAVAPPPPASSSLVVAPDWQFAPYGSRIGAAGLFVHDLDGDARPEIVATAGSAWYVLDFDGSGYTQRWVSPSYPDSIGALILAEVDGDPAPEVLVATGDRVLVYDGATRVLERTIYDAPRGIKAMAVGDLEADGRLSLVVTDGANVYVYGLASGELEYEGEGLGGVAVAVGDLDGKAGLEIVVANGIHTGYVLGGGPRHRVRWARPDGFGFHVEIADLTGTGGNEIVAGFNDSYGIAMFDAVRRVQTGGYSIQQLNAFTLADTDGDGRAEILYGDGQIGSVHVLDGATLTERWSYPNSNNGVTAIAWGDTDGDGHGELVYGAWSTNQFSHFLNVVDGDTHALDWSSPDAVGGTFALAAGDLDGDGRMKFVTRSAHPSINPGDPQWLVHDATTHALEFMSQQATGRQWTGSARVVLANVDADPQMEVFVPTSDLYRGAVECYDGLTHALQWRRLLDDSSEVVALAIADVDGDGALEVVVGLYPSNATSAVIVLDAATGAVEWQSPYIGARRWSLQIGRASCRERV